MKLKIYLLLIFVFLLNSMIAQNEKWAWLKGDSRLPMYPEYGTLNSPNSVNLPGGRQEGVTWTDTAGNFWLFGGTGYAANGSGMLNDLWKYNSNTEMWTWIKGSKIINQSGVYGTKGNPNVTNNPGARSGSVSWIDSSGNLWLFGGFGYDSNGLSDRLNDLWKYSTSTNMWTWISGDSTVNQQSVYGAQGTSATTNKPGSRNNSISWIDNSGNLWLFGGNGYATTNSPGVLNDLWKFNPITSVWTWVSGDTIINSIGFFGDQGIPDINNRPKGRENCVGWKDSFGNFWLFGGISYGSSGSGIVNDLWKYTPTTNEWTWMKGDTVADQYGNYGKKGASTISSKPGVRYGSVSWSDDSGNLWLFGGFGLSESGQGYLNDMWKYNTATNRWSWVNGDSIENQSGVYGNLGNPNANNKPGSRRNPMSWTDNSGNLWQFGGDGYDSLDGVGRMNDLWKYRLNSNQWVWMKGDDVTNHYGVYGRQGNTSSTNKPGPRSNCVTWTDNTGKLWLFGGYGFAASGVSGFLNDLWRYNPSNNVWSWIKGDFIINTAGVYGTLGNASSTNKPGARTGSITWKDSVGNLWLFGGMGYDSNGETGHLNDLWKYDINTNVWTWISGNNIKNQSGDYGSPGIANTTNKPGAREESHSWTDNSGNLWLFGGVGFASNGTTGFLNDLWKYNPATNMWTWMKGDNSMNQNGVFGSQGISAITNKPGAKINGVTWVDASGNLWLFGGYGYTNNQGIGYLNDLWKYNTSSNEWTWMKGDNTTNQYGIYGTKGKFASTNKPGGRSESFSWIDSAGYLWLFGGTGYSSSGEIGFLNDLWKFSPLTNDWQWSKGDNIKDQFGIYGSQGTPSLANNPGGRSNGASWIEGINNLWLFGGFGFAVSGGSGYRNDLWKIDVTQMPAITTFTPSSGPANSTVVINGSGFLGVTAVTIGGTPVNSFVVNSDFAITAVVGAGTTGVITILSPGGTSTSSNVFTVTSNRENVITVSTHENYIWTANGQTYNTSGIYTHYIGKEMVKLNLTIINNPTANAGTPITTCSVYGAVNITPGSSATNYMSVLWTSNGSGTFSRANSLTGCTYTPSAADISAGSVILTLTAYGDSESGSESSSKTLTINTAIMPIFNSIDPICQGGASPLMAPSLNGISGNWTPSFNNNISQYYYFTPSVGECAYSTSEFITVLTNFNWYQDLDNDTFGNPLVSQQYCYQPVGYVFNNKDCNDTVASINPNATEKCWNNIDDNCNGTLSEGCTPIPVYMQTINNYVLPSFATTLVAQSYSYHGANSLEYRFSIKNNQTGQIVVITSSTRYVTIPANIQNYNVNYEVKVSAVINGETLPYVGNVIRVYSPIISLVKLAPLSCGITLPSLSSTITSQIGLNATSYTFRLRLTSDNGSNPTYYTVQSASRVVNLNSFDGFTPQYATSYTIDVQFNFLDVISNTIVSTGYGESCVLNTPSIPIIGMSTPICGTTLHSMNATITANRGFYAGLYQFRIRLTSDNRVNPFYYYTVPNESRISNLSSFQGLTIQFNTSYTLSARYKIMINGYEAWSEYGTTCQLTTPLFPETEIEPSQCGLLSTDLNQTIDIVPYPGNASYRITLFEQIGENISLVGSIIRAEPNFTLRMIPGTEINKYYGASISIYINGVFGPEGKSCDISTFLPIVPRTNEKPFDAIAFPNPFTNSFQLDVSTSYNKTITVQVFDMLGRLVEQSNTNNNDIETIMFGERIPSGVYNVIVSQDNEIKTTRIVKR